jgi:hypothetical protein
VEGSSGGERQDVLMFICSRETRKWHFGQWGVDFRLAGVVWRSATRGASIVPPEGDEENILGKEIGGHVGQGWDMGWDVMLVSMTCSFEERS